MRGKEKCKALKEIRRQIAEENDIPFAVSQCTHQGDCKGTCPKCESELRYLERELAVRQGLGKAVAVVGISTSVCAGLTACSPADAIRNAVYGVEETAGATTLGIGSEELSGDVQPFEPTQEEIEGETETGETEEILMGMIMPAEETEEIATSELAGDIPIEETGEEMP